MRTADQPIRLTLVAPDGRMGKAIEAAAGETNIFVIDQDHGDVLIDFSAPAALPASLELALRSAIPILIGTTGLDDFASRRIAEASRSIAILQTANTSLGVAVLAQLVQRAAGILGNDWDIEVVEMHHRRKTDAPSGTALMLGEAAARGRGQPLVAESGRSGLSLERAEGAVGFSAVRGGTIVGDHDVLFAGRQERLILSHRAEDRMLFARGALAAARFLKGREAGLYTMRDVVDTL